MAAPATNVKAARRHRLAFVTLNVVTPFTSLEVVVRDVGNPNHVLATAKGGFVRLADAA